MTVFTFGPINVTQFGVETSIPLSTMIERLGKDKYKRPAPARGWARIDLSSDGAPSVDRSAPGTPTTILVPGVGEESEARVTGLARLLVDDPNTNLPDLGDPELMAGFSEGQRFNEVLVDVMIVGGDSPAEPVTGFFVSSHDESDVQRVRSRLKEAAADGHHWSDLMGFRHKGPLPSFFLWCFHRYVNGLPITDEISIIDFRKLRSQTTSGRRMAASGGVADDRIDVLGAVAQGEDLGPITITLDHSRLNLTVDLLLLNDASYSIHRGVSEYYSITEEFDGPKFGTRSTLDVATVVIPEAVDAFESDTKWNGQKIGKFREESAQKIIDLLTPRR